MKNKKVLFIAQTAGIAAMYAALTYAQNLLLPGTTSAAVQFRVSEALNVLALFTPAAIPGLTLGCVLSNLSLIHISEPTRQAEISYAVFCLKKKKNNICLKKKKE